MEIKDIQNYGNSSQHKEKKIFLREVGGQVKLFF